MTHNSEIILVTVAGTNSTLIKLIVTLEETALTLCFVSKPQQFSFRTDRTDPGQTDLSIVADAFIMQVHQTL